MQRALPRFLLLPIAAVTFLLASLAAPAAAQLTDTDGDTMPDVWETYFGLNPNDAADATGDPDGDGLSNAQEHAAGRHPDGRFARFFAEGSTGYFSTSVAVLNLSPTDTAHVNIALLDESGGVTSHRVTLGPRQRQSVPFETVLPMAAAVSIVVESDTPIAADRIMTWGTSGIGLSLDSGAPAPATTWYFAEGATGPFLLYYLFENPGPVAANVTVRYLREGGAPVVRTRTLPPNSRTTVFVNDEDPALATASLGAVVTSDVPILAERSMYLFANGTFGGGAASSGANALSTQWYFGEGATGPFFHAFLSLLNPGSTPATATVTYHMSDGSTASKAYAVPAAGRRTVYFNDEGATDAALAALANGPVWFTVSSTQPIVGERAMWWSTWPWHEGHAAAGSTVSDVNWGVAGGSHGGPLGDQTYVLIGNTTTTAGQVRVTLIPETGAVDTRDLAIAAGARLTVDVGDLFGLTESRFSVIVESLGAPPAPLAVDYARYRSVNALPFSGGGAAPAVPLLPGDTAPSVLSTTPANGAPGASSTANLVVTFSEAVQAGAGAFTLACPSGTPIALTVVTASPASQFTLDPTVPLPPSTACTVTVEASAITDVDATDPPDVMTADVVATFTTAAESTPAVSTTTPAPGAAQIGLAANVTITFSEPVDVTGSWFQIACAIGGTRTVADTVVTGGPTAFTIDPNADFVAGETCTVTVVAAQVTDQDLVDPPDAMAANHDFAFTTDVAPTVVGTTPINGAASLGTTTSLSVTFSEPVTVAGSWFQIVCATSGTRNVADTVVSGGPTIFTIDPNADFAPGELCTVTIAAAQVADQDAGDPPDTLAANVVFSFTIDTPPSVTGTTPTNGATDATTTGNLTVTFSEPVNVAGSWFQIACATSGIRTVGDAVVTGGPTTFSIDPNADFVPGETCTVTVAAASVADQDAGDPPDSLAANYVFAFTVDAAPAITATTPTNGATASTTASLTVTFSEPVNVTGNWFQVVCATSGTRNVADTSVTGGPSTFTIDPITDLAGGETCTVTVFAAQVADQDAADPPDTLAANFVFSFTTDAAPSVTATTPVNGAASETSSSNLTVTFSEPVNAAGGSFTLNCTASGTHTFALSGGPATWTLNPDVDFAAGETCTLTVLAAGVTDQDADDPPNNMVADFVASFTIDARPSVTATTPTNGATQVASDANLAVIVSEPVDVTGNWFQIVCSVSGTRNVADTVVTGGPTVFTINPNVDFSGGDTCTVTVFAAQVADQDAVDPPDTMAANYVFSYQIDVPPSITGTLPVNGATSVSPATAITVNFSESVNATTSSFTLDCSGARAFTLSASPASTFVLTPTSALPSGVVCTVTVHASQVTDADAGDPPDTMLTNYVFTFSIPPDAVNDTYPQTVIGNVPVNSSQIPYATATNDVSATAFTITAYDGTTAQGGSITMVTSGAGMGQFVYNPPAGYEGADSFTYTIGNATGTDSATVALAVSGMIWFVNENAGAAGDGRLGTPFDTLQAFAAVNDGIGNHPANNDSIFLYESVTPYTIAGTTVALRNGQRLIGQDHATSSLATLAGVVVPSGSIALPAMIPGGSTTNIVDTVRLESNAQVHGLSITNTGAIGLDDPAGAITGVSTSQVRVTTTGAPAISLSSTGGTLSFDSVTSSGGGNGIVLTNTTGSFAVTGTGTPGSGGAIQSTVGANGATTGIGIYLNNAQNVSLARMLIQNHANFGIWGTGLPGFSLTNSTVAGVNGQYIAGFTPDTREGSIALRQLSGTVSLTGNTIQGGAQDNINIINDSGTLTSLQITGNTIQQNDATNGEDGLWLQARSTAVMSAVNIATNQFNYHRGDHIDARAENSASMNITVGSNTMVGDGGTTEGGTSLGSTVLLFATNDADMTFAVNGNTMRGSVASALTVNHSPSSTSNSTLSGTVSNNQIGLVGTPDSGSSQGSTIGVDARGAGHTIVAVTGNTLRQYNNHGISITAGEGNPSTAQITVTGNTIANPGTFAINGIALNAGPASSDAFTMCLAMSGNGITGAGLNSSAGEEDFRVRQRRPNIAVHLPGYAGGANDTTAVVNFLRAANPTNPTGSATAVAGGTGGFLGGAACTMP
jgi:large repetitive protein